MTERKLPSAPESRLLISPSLLKATGSTGVNGAIEKPSRPNKPRITGSLYERQSVAKVLDYLRNIAVLKGGYSWQSLLSGETPASDGGVRLNPAAIIRDAGVRQDKSPVSIHKFVAGPDYHQLETEDPTSRYKFYHSFKDQARGRAYMVELVEHAAERRLSLSMKSFDHAYDGMNVYTHHFQEVSALVGELYPKYVDAFYKTEHFLQGPLEGVDLRHIGWVQEPEAGVGQRSHSGRMGQIGGALDIGGLNEEAYRQGCYTAGVRPSQPWLLTEQYEEQIAQAYQARLHA